MGIEVKRILARIAYALEVIAGIVPKDEVKPEPEQEPEPEVKQTKGGKK